MRVLFIIVALSFVVSGCKRPSRDISNVQITTIGSQPVAGPNIIKMTPMGGVYEIPVEINGTKMDFIFDTGASSISISELEALVLLKKGQLKREDILGTVQFQDATGRISEGTTIVLRSVIIGNKEIKDVEANVVHNMEAPLLLGQSALAQFGKVTIDYQKNQLSFE